MPLPLTSKATVVGCKGISGSARRPPDGGSGSIPIRRTGIRDGPCGSPARTLRTIDCTHETGGLGRSPAIPLGGIWYMTWALTRVAGVADAAIEQFKRAIDAGYRPAFPMPCWRELRRRGGTTPRRNSHWRRRVVSTLNPRSNGFWRTRQFSQGLLRACAEPGCRKNDL